MLKAGYLKTIKVDKGDTVKAGHLIADIEVPELLADRTQFKAQMDVAKAEYNRVQQAIKTAPDLVTPQSVDEARGKLLVAGHRTRYARAAPYLCCCARAGPGILPITRLTSVC